MERNAMLDNEGREFEIGNGASLTIAAWQNPKFKEKFARLAKPHLSAMRAGLLAPEVQDKIMSEAMAGTVLLNWKGMAEDGKDIPFSEEVAAAKLLKYERLREIVTGYAQTLAEIDATVENEGIEAAKKVSSGG